MCNFRFFRLAGSALAVLVTLASPVSAQGRWSATLHGGIGLPTGDFADATGEEAGLATLGFALGSDLAMRIDAVPGLEWVSTVQGVTFGVDEDFIGDFGPGVDINLGRYWGALAMTGLQFGFGESTPRFHVVGQMLAGMIKAPGATFAGMGQTAELVASWKPAKGFSLGAGAEIGERLFMDVRYEALINTEIELEFRDGGTSETFEGEQPTSWIRVSVGVRVW
jgi:hypothetical protein